MSGEYSLIALNCDYNSSANLRAFNHSARTAIAPQHQDHNGSRLKKMFSLFSNKLRQQEV